MLRPSIVLCGLSTIAVAQTSGWQFGFPGRDLGFLETTEVHALTIYDPDRAGPEGPHLVVAGGSTDETNQLAPGLALYDPESGYWRELGAGVDGTVRAVQVGPTGDLFIAGDFTQAGDVPALRIARWDGERWHALEEGIDEQTGATVRSFVVTKKGAIHVAGVFEFAGAVRATGTASYLQGEWRGLGRGIEGAVCTTSLLTNGEFAVAGNFEFAGDVYASNVARWDGESWQPFGQGVEGSVYSALALPKGGLVVGGRFEFAGIERVTNVARWNGKEWRPMEPGIDCSVTGLARLPNGHIAACTAEHGVLRWDGEIWHEVEGAESAELDAYLHTILAAPDGTLFAGGEGLYSWDGRAWVTLLERETF